MLTELFDYELPESAIAQAPPAERDAGRLLELAPGGLQHRWVRDLVELIPTGDLVVFNDTRVRAARLLGRRAGSGGRTELLLLSRDAVLSEQPSVERWTALGRANRPLETGAQLEFPDLTAVVLEREPRHGVLQVQLQATVGSVEQAVELGGHVPLPPYVRRSDTAQDRARYQTVYAASPGSAAAPTAGLHFTERGLSRLRERGVELGFITLDVGLGTFRPVSVPDLDHHPMHRERFHISQELVRQVHAARARGARLVAVGTTVVRALEASAQAARAGELLKAGESSTELLIQPGYTFLVVDSLLTNFHMPRSTLLALVSAFAGRERVLDAYREALREGYRFLSYGDAMWIPERLL